MLQLNKYYNLNKNIFSSPDLEANRVGFGVALKDVGKTNKDVVALCCDLTESTRIIEFAKAYPERFFEIGVAEQNLAGIAAGMALTGKIPFMASYAAFSPGRNFDQIRVSIAYSNTNVKIIGAHAGVTVGPDGATHQMLEDVALMRTLPNMTVIVPADFDQAYAATVAATSFVGPVYIRLAREKTPKITTSTTPFTIGKANVYAKGRDVTIIANGPMVYEALVAAEALEKQKINVEVIDCHSVKPLDAQTILTSVAKTGAVVTAEEAQVTGGLGGAVAELLGEHMPVPLKRIGVLDRFGESGEPAELMKAFHLTAHDIQLAVHEVIARKNR
ncbi:transketolase [Candidatus Berkelbacteria bacterium CG06_land_8_20_14_3_00_43_10]|uniref:Transketolase n=1 Tax=Candidatus Berkelbacteria bacterium CG10_big_fil_rev_8_21_14_0_10_43_14 TaxID=1974515 RepID=A0A2M6R935_9BACT|nr:MAG: transketolase [Candidatus Berkelbacteria bacterium CG10_big_fil_rev_8_21_14_0_10_43_14]PIU87480.1 MAG: transketolase [Candidatus Berkelbacteria bacterium CG06_land_8_20_14_3_00_43_10]